MGKLNVVAINNSATFYKMTVTPSPKTEFKYDNIHKSMDEAESILNDIKKDPPDIIFCSWKMLTVNSLELVDMCRQEPELDKTHIVIVITVADHEAVKKARQVGANFLVTKPFNAFRIKDRIFKILKKIK